MKGELDIVILAAGWGRRMGGLTAEHQKCMLPVAGEPILAHIVKEIKKAFGSASTRIIIATGHRSEEIQSFFSKDYSKIPIEYVHDPNPQGPRGTLLKAEDSLRRQPFMLLAGDIITSSNLLVCITEQYERGTDFGVISGTTHLDIAPTHRLITYEGNNKAIRIDRDPKVTDGQKQLRDISAKLLDHRIINLIKTGIPGSDTTPVLDQLIQNGVSFSVVQSPSICYHFAKPEDLQIDQIVF